MCHLILQLKRKEVEIQCKTLTMKKKASSEKATGIMNRTILKVFRREGQRNKQNLRQEQ